MAISKPRQLNPIVLFQYIYHKLYNYRVYFFVCQVNYNNNMLWFYAFLKSYPNLEGDAQIETFEKRSILFKVKEGENFNHRHTLSIPRIKI